MEPTGRRFTIAAGLLLLPLSSRSVADVLFVDATIGSGLETFVHTPNYLSTPGANEWFLGGIGVADFNSDGWPDFIVTKGGVGADRLYLNNGNGTFTNAAAPWGVNAVHAGNGVSCADFDRDGDVDVYMTSYGSSTQNTGTPGQNRLYRNEGLFFTNVASSAGVAFTSPSSSVGDSAAWGDYDLDGDLDLATSGWSASGLANRLFRNDGGSFLDVSSTSISIPASWGFQPTFIDLTDDGFPELLLARGATIVTAHSRSRHRSSDSVSTTTAWAHALPISMATRRQTISSPACTWLAQIRACTTATRST